MGIKKTLVVVAAIFALGLGGAYFYAQDFLDTIPPLTEPITINVEKGNSFYTVAYRLRDQGIVKNPMLLVRIGQVFGYSSRMKFGEYRIEPGMSYRVILQKLAAGQSLKYEIVFTPGSHMFDLAKILADKGLGTSEQFFALVLDRVFIQELLGEDQESLEGYLFPDTYYFVKADSLRTVIATMVNRFKEIYGQLAGSQNLSRHQLVTLASIIEKETGVPAERPVISSVFHNRLKQKIPLATDPTIIYGILRRTGSEIKNIKKIHLQDASPYNTYRLEGLPPGPIGSPGKEALQAALQPENTDFLFFVSRNDGTHVFTTNYDDHKAAIKTWQLDPKMRDGRSWRDFNKNQQTN